MESALTFDFISLLFIKINLRLTQTPLYTIKLVAEKHENKLIKTA